MSGEGPLASMEDACRLLEVRGALKRHRHDHSVQVIEHVTELIGGWVPPELAAFYRERVSQVADFLAVAPVWNDRIGWRSEDWVVTQLLHVQAVPILSDGCGSLFGVDLSDRIARPQSTSSIMRMDSRGLTGRLARPSASSCC